MMLLRLVRQRSTRRVTFGTLFVDDEFECLTLEDGIRERPGVPVAEWKVPKETAIPRWTLLSAPQYVGAIFGAYCPYWRMCRG